MDADSSTKPPSRWASYNKIAIHHSTLSARCLGNAIKSARTLREFAYSVGGRASLAGCPVTTHYDDLFKTLLIHRNTLEHLDLDMEGDAIALSDSFDIGQFAAHPWYLDDDFDDEDSKDSTYESHWAEELKEFRTSLNTQTPSQSSPLTLKSFHALKHLRLEALLLCYLARGIEEDMIDVDSFSLVDNLPPHLESLYIYGYGEYDSCVGPLGLNLEDQIAKLMAEKGEKLPSLKVVHGVDDPIPHAETIDDNLVLDHPSQARLLCWVPEPEEWSDYEY